MAGHYALRLPCGGNHGHLRGGYTFSRVFCCQAPGKWSKIDDPTP